MVSLSKDKNVAVYQLAKEYLDSIKPEGTDLSKYFLGDSRSYSSLKDVYVQMIKSAQNYRQMPKVINFDLNEKELRRMLQGFDYTKIRDLLPEDLYRSFRKQFDCGGADNKHNSWYKWSCSVVDAAKFMSEFKDVDDFNKFVERFNYNVQTRIALPLLIDEKIRGIGFALACDFLKELGFIDYAKPDVHLIEVFSKLGLSDATQISTFEAVARMAERCNNSGVATTPYEVDKTFWLICSGDFYYENNKVGRHKKEFIEYAKEKLAIS